jgi:hypothetical protein
LDAVLPVGGYHLIVFAHSTVTGTFTGQGVDVTVIDGSDPAMSVDVPGADTTQPGPFAIGGWALDRGATSGTGIAAVHVWAFPLDSGGPPVFIGLANYGAPRADVAAAFGASFINCGYSIVASLPSGRYQIGVFPLSAVSGSFNQSRFFTVTVGGTGM